MAVIGILAALLLPAITQGRDRAKRISCINNLRQVGVAFQDFAHDHNGQFPMAVPASAGGSEEFTSTSYRVAGDFFFSFRHFQALSNELVTPKLLACPADTRQPADSFGAFHNENLSYLVGLRSDYSHPNSILAGDRNVTNDLAGTSTLVRLQNNRGWRWTSELHQFKGNLLFSDGHVEERGTPALVSSFDQGLLTAELALPTLMGTGIRSPVAAIPPNPGAGSPTVASSLAPSSQNASPSPQSSTRRENQLSFVASAPVEPRSLSAPLQPDEQKQTFTNNKTQTSRTRAPNAAIEKPGKDQEPGFSFFPPVIGATISGLLNEGAWILYLLLLLIIGTALVRRLRSASLKPTSRKAHFGGEDAD